MKDFLIEDDVISLDPDVAKLTGYESERQARRLIMIPSESIAPRAVRDLLATSFTNIYAEGYPRPETRYQSQEEILDYAASLASFRRHSDGRYYKGVEYADIVEALARRRAAELFATNGQTPDDLWVNVQPLSGAPANTAVYTALIQPGDAILGMDLLHGGHLTHGSPVNRSGLFYHAYHYTVDPETEQLNYETILEQAKACKPKVIVAGYTSYPWVPDWQKFREIADEVGAYLLADVSHIAGLIAAGHVASPIGIADVTSFTTHKTLCGPRGAVLIMRTRELGEKVDKGVFPGEQGGPHVNTMAAMALTFKLAQTAEFSTLQKQIILNAKALAQGFVDNGIRVPYRGTDTHMCLIDCKGFKAKDGVPLNGDLGARILDLVGIVANRNTIPGDASALRSSGIRFGTPWLTQRGYGEADMVTIAEQISKLFKATTPYLMCGRVGKKTRAKVDFKAFNDVSNAVRDLSLRQPVLDKVEKPSSYPHFFYSDDKFEGKYTAFEISGEKVRSFLYYLVTSDPSILKPGESQPTRVNTTEGSVDGTLTCIDPMRFKLTVPSEKAALTGTWLNGISSGFIYYDEDKCQRIRGPVSVVLSEPVKEMASGDPVDNNKAYFVGMDKQYTAPAKPEWTWVEPEGPNKRTCLYQKHVDLGAKVIPFAGYEMPVWYTSVVEEHMAVRKAAGLFDVSHMGVFQCEGPDASLFLDSVCSNDVISLEVGESYYTHFMAPNADVIDDLLVYRRDKEKYLVVVNAANEAKDWAWLQAVISGEVCVDPYRPWMLSPGRNVILRNLRDPKEGADMKVDIALQGPLSRDVLLRLSDADAQRRIMRLGRTELCDTVVAGVPCTVSRTGYTGEKMCFELFVHPDDAPKFWDDILEAGKDLGVKPCGLGARDSLRTEAGLPLYGHEMGGDFNLTISEAGFVAFVKLNTSWFIGRSAFRERDRLREVIVIRFRFNDKGVRMAHHGDPVLDAKGRMIGRVTSCAVDSDGYLTGQAVVEEKYAVEGASIFIFQSASDKPQRPPAELTEGDKVALPSPATILPRFMK